MKELSEEQSYKEQVVAFTESPPPLRMPTPPSINSADPAPSPTSASVESTEGISPISAMAQKVRQNPQHRRRRRRPTLNNNFVSSTLMFYPPRKDLKVLNHLHQHRMASRKAIVGVFTAIYATTATTAAAAAAAALFPTTRAEASVTTTAGRNVVGSCHEQQHHRSVN